MTVANMPECRNCGTTTDASGPCEQCRIHDYRMREFRSMVVDGLRWCGLPLVVSKDSIAPSVKVSELHEFGISHRNRGYWVVGGTVPIELARKLYADPAGRDLIRVAGHCGCPPPDEWCVWIAPDGRHVAKAKDLADFDRVIAHGGPIAATMTRMKACLHFNDDPESIGAKAYVENYHIDGDLGLRVFVDTVRAEVGH